MKDIPQVPDVHLNGQKEKKIKYTEKRAFTHYIFVIFRFL